MRSLVLPLLVSLFALGCGSSQTRSSEAAPEPAPEPAPIAEPTPPPKPVPGDPKEVGPTIYKSLVENETVRAFEVTFKPGDTIGLHKHPDHVIYVVSGGKLRVTPEEGAAQELELTAGQAIYAAPEAHSGENIGTTEVKLIVVEMMKKGAAAPEGKDPLVAAPTMYKLILDDPHVRVLEVTFKKGQKIAKHAHPDHVGYIAAGGNLAVTGGDKGAKPETFDLQTGTAVWLPAQAHSAVNKSAGEVKIVVFEVKP